MKRERRQSGAALVTVLMISVVFSLMLVGFFFVVNGEQKISASDRDHTTAFYGAEAGMEKMNADLGLWFAHHTSPTAAQIAALATPSKEPVIPGITYPAPGSVDYPQGGYTIVPAPPPAGQSGCVKSGGMWSCPGTIGGTGPLAGLQGVITPFTLTVVAEGPSNTEVKMTREIQEVSVPVFEFGIFSDTDLSYFAGPPFNFGGRVHTNGNLFLAEGDGNTLTLSDKVSAAKDVVRAQLSNGWPTSSSYNGTVNGLVTPGNYRAVGQNEGSVQGGAGSAPNPNWSNISLSLYNGNIVNGPNGSGGAADATGGKPLNLDFAVAGTANPIEIIRRPPIGEDPTSVLGQARLYNQANLLIIIFDPTTESNTFGSSDPLLSMGVTLDNSATGFGNGTPEGQAGFGPASWYTSSGTFDGCHPPIAATPNPVPPGGPYLLPADTPLLGGDSFSGPFKPARIVIAIQNGAGNWTDVTKDVLKQGIVTGGGCASVLGLEQYAYVGTDGGYDSTSPYGYIPISIYDTREGELRDTATTCSKSNPTGPCLVALNGVMDLVNLDIKDLQQYLAGNLGTTGTQAIPNDGYIVYFSDRRGNVDPSLATGPFGEGCQERYPGAPVVAPCSTGEYGNEDIVNPSCGLSTNCLPDGVLEPAEDVNGNGLLDTYGAQPDWIVASEQTAWTTAGLPLTIAGTPGTMPEVRVTAAQANNPDPSCTIGGNPTCLYPSLPQANPPLFFRRALRLVDGSLGNLPPLTTASCANATGGGFTVASENPVYIQGDYNGTAAVAAPDPAANWPDQPGQCHVPSSVMADAVTVLSNNWNDQESYNSADDPDNRPGVDTAFRTAIIAGKNLSFPNPGGTYQDFGTDGGVHNFLRYMEGWGGSNYYYHGSLVSLFISRQGTGVYKCCSTVYGPPTRKENFDADFLSITTLPPGTPRFTDINTLSFQQAVLATQ